jgi:hypothetical protein
MWDSSCKKLWALFHHAVRRHDLDKVKELVDEGHDINGLDHHGNTPLILAAQRSYHITEYLLRHGASSSLEIANSNGETPFTVTEDDEILDLLNKYADDAMRDDLAGEGDEYGPVCGQITVRNLRSFMPNDGDQSMPEPDGNIW